MKTPNLEADEKTFRASYAADGGYNAVMEIKATDNGLEIDESVTVPWDWILEVKQLFEKERPSPVTPNQYPKSS
jgi:hypothetical protein